MDDPNRSSEERFLRALGLEIAYWRKQRGLTQVQLAERVGISEATLKRAERKGPQGNGDLWRIAQTLRVDIVVMIDRAKKVSLGDGQPVAETDEEPDQRYA